MVDIIHRDITVPSAIYGPGPSAAESAFAKDIEAFEATKGAFYFKPGRLLDSMNSDFVAHAAPGEHWSDFFARDRYGRVLNAAKHTSNPNNNRFPYLVKAVYKNDDTPLVTTPTLLHGMSPDGRLTYGQSGSMLPDDDWNDDVFVPGAHGWTSCHQMLVINRTTDPIIKIKWPDDTIVSFTVPAYSGLFSIMGAQAARDSGGKPYSEYYDSSGILIITNRHLTNQWTSLNYGLDHRDTTLHTYIKQFDQVAQTIKVWEYNGVSGGNLIGTKTSVSVDILDQADTGNGGSAANAKMRIGAIGPDAGGTIVRNSGAFFGPIGWWPSSALSDSAAKRDRMFADMLEA